MLRGVDFVLTNIAMCMGRSLHWRTRRPTRIPTRCVPGTDWGTPLPQARVRRAWLLHPLLDCAGSMERRRLGVPGGDDPHWCDAPTGCLRCVLSTRVCLRHVLPCRGASTCRRPPPSALGKLHNSGHNCLAAEVLVTDAEWPQRQQFLDVLQRKAGALAQVLPAVLPYLSRTTHTHGRLHVCTCPYITTYTHMHAAHTTALHAV